jgi:hypothetical protein
MTSKCMSCYNEGLETYVQSRRSEISLATVNTYLSDGRRFSNFFIDGSMRVKGSTQTTTARGANGKISAEDASEFISSLIDGGMATTSATVYLTPIEGAFRHAPICHH